MLPILNTGCLCFYLPFWLTICCTCEGTSATKLYIFVAFSSDSTILAELKNDITASIKYVSSVVQDPCLISKLFSVRNLWVLFLCKLDGLEVHLMFLFCFKETLLAYLLPYSLLHPWQRQLLVHGHFLYDSCILFVFYLWCQCNFWLLLHRFYCWLHGDKKIGCQYGCF